MIIAIQTLIFFRQSLLTALDRLLRPYFQKFALSLTKSSFESDDDEPDENVFAEYDDEKGVIFFPPMYVQRYAAIVDCLLDERWSGKLDKVVDLGYHDMSFIKYLKEVSGIKSILGVDLETIPLQCSSDLLSCNEYAPKRETPLQISLLQGNAADPDYRLIGCDAVIAIEMIEHMLPHDLERLVHTVFAFIKPWIVIFTTPNGDFNVLFKSLEKNGLRRLDHFFEWSRDQFHDWCSNIVTRYPEYTVSCRGIGPGPEGTEHLGCCSQMALFVSKNYHKQKDLNLNSLALVANDSVPNDLSDVIDNWESPELMTEMMIYPVNNIESYTDITISEKQSQVTFYVPSKRNSSHKIEFQDKSTQCNLDFELARNFLMFDNEDMCFNILYPRKKVVNKVYEIEDVYSRLNCTTLQVKKFSKTTQGLMAKNKVDALVHTREVVEEIKHLTKMLNFNKSGLNQQDEKTHIWYNFNWGENAPYWNQYYKIVREYNYPFETKSDDCRILDLISDEMNRLIDLQYDDILSVDLNKLEIPLQHLMQTVQHITDDVEKVRELLEWNGYEVVDDMVIYSRLAIDNVTIDSQIDDWQENESVSDWDTADFRSTSISDGSANQDYHGRCLLRAIDHKLRKLRSMLTAGEDISTELDRAVCRLMKLALQSSKYRCTPPPAKWMQCKLLDLLTLTEKAIEKRKRHYIENFPLKAIECDPAVFPGLTLENTKKIGQNEILEKYSYLTFSTEKLNANEFTPRPKYSPIDIDLEDDLSISSTDLLKVEYEYIERFSPTRETDENKLNLKKFDDDLKDWDDNDMEANLCSDHDYNKYDNSSGDTDHSANNKRLKFKRSNSYKKRGNRNKIANKVDCLRKTSKKCFEETPRRQDERKTSSTKIIKKVIRKKSSYSCLVKTCSYKDISMEYGIYTMKIKRSLEHKRSTATKPIPESLIELCHPEMTLQKDYDKFHYTQQQEAQAQTQDIGVDQDYQNISAAEESFFIDIISTDNTETLALRRTIGTDPDFREDNNSVVQSEKLIRSVSNDAMNVFDICQAVEVATVPSQAVFISDVDEPSTSKGIRHISLDVQCGPDEISKYCMLSPATSMDRFPMSTGIKIGDSLTNLVTKSTDCSTSMLDSEQCNIVTPKVKNFGIRIQDSDPCFKCKMDSSTITQDESYINTEINDTAELAIIGNTKTDDSEFPSIEGLSKISELAIQSLHGIDAVTTLVPKVAMATGNISPTKCLTPRLSYGAVHVHSYREKQGVHDVVYQGEWQRYRPNTRGEPLKSPISKETKLTVDRKKRSPKEKIIGKDARKEVEKQNYKRPVQMRKALESKTKSLVREENTIVSSKVPKIRAYKGSKKITKVASKVTVSSISSKNSKGTYVVKKTDVTNIKPDGQYGKASTILRRNYIPLYLRQRMKMEKSLSNVNNKSINNPIETTGIFQIHKQNLKSLANENNHFNFNKERRERYNFLVYRNENEKKDKFLLSKVATKASWQSKERANRSFSPQSQNSSTCSSPNSIATIRVAFNKKSCQRVRQSASPPLTSKSLDPRKSQSPASTKTSIMRTTGRKTKLSENKENIPHQNENINKNKDKRVFVRDSKNVYISQLKVENTSKQVDRKSSLKQKKSLKLNTTSLDNATEKQTSDLNVESETKAHNSKNLVDNENVCEIISNLTSIVEPSIKVHISEPTTPEKRINRQGLVTDWIDSSNIVLTATADNVAIGIRQLIERTLDFIDDSVDGDIGIDSETVVLNQENHNLSGDEILSQTSFTSAIDDERFYSGLENEPNNAPTCSFSSALDDEFLSLGSMGLEINEFDLLSFKSMPSHSDYVTVSDVASRIDSMRELFERKDTQVPQKAAGTLAIQAFSGFSLNSEPFVGDQPDRVNLIDSETGSLAVEITRQATSEEMFVSGRSSESYESCVLDEDAVVPDWLFRIISQQQEMSEEPETGGLIIPLPYDEPMALAEPMYDVNSNVVEPVGAGSGAGDGRGIHSDYSQDSSGRGTSLSSSDTSSGARSETITIDPSSFAVQLEVVGEGIDVSSDLNQIRSEQSLNIEGATNSRRVRERRTIDQPVTSSDVEADVSSTDTDVPDSDN
ncbi:small RNA 2'-O-methyltransferase isoform X3 [Bombyx mori]|uniref:Small RNA 2'-O-methyltransferase n=1 Tax=Bombyx mori TaxID=7091 RepID=A0A8R2R2F3_BOMMO|nr:small RNA 2'-O-methyltransferase isoform X3 [Bombyx mori]